MKTGKVWGIASMALGGCVLAGILCSQTAVGAVFDETKAIRYQEYAAFNTIEESVLFIGTYLIHAQALTDELYEKAVESGSDANQMEIYYKSELAGGAWFDITDAYGLADITDQGTVVTEAQLADLWVTCYTGSDGITRDAKDGHSVNIFDTPDPYDLYNLPELEPIRIQYDNVFPEDTKGVKKYYHNYLRAFFDLNLKNEITDNCDRQLAGLQRCYESLQQVDKKELAEIVSTLMKKIDARRRAEVFARLSEIDGNELSRLQRQCSGSEYDKKIFNDEQFVEDANVSDAIGSSIQNCQQSYITHSGGMLTDGSTVLQHAEYGKSMSVVELAEGGPGPQIETILTELRDLYHIQDDVVANAGSELKLLETELLNNAEKAYTDQLAAGAGGAYQAAVANGASQVARAQVLEQQKADVNAVRSELQYLIEAKTKRVPAEAATAFTYDRIRKAEGFYAVVATDDFHTKAGETVDDHILWLQQLAKTLSDGSGSAGSEIGKLEEKKQELLDKQAEALDNNELSAAKKYDALIAMVDQEIAQKEKELSAVLADASSSAADKAQAANQAGDSTTLNRINQLKQDALAEIADGNTDGNDGLDNMVSALASLGAESALAEIKDKLEVSGAGSGTLKEVEKAIADSKESSLHEVYGGGAGTGTGEEAGTGEGTGEESGTGTSDGTGTGTGSGDGVGSGAETGSGTVPGTGTGTGDGTGTDAALAGLTEPQLTALIEQIFGRPFHDLNAADKSAATAAMDRIGEAGNQAAKDLARIYLNQCVTESSRYVFQKLKGEPTEHIPLTTIGTVCGYRYVYSDSRQEATLTAKGRVYLFIIYSDELAMRDGSKEQLSAPVRVQQIPYIAEKDAADYFRCSAEYIASTDYGVCLNEKMEKKAQELVLAAQEGAQ